MQRIILTEKPAFEDVDIPKRGLRRKLYKLVTDQRFDIFIMVCIVLNMVQMGMFYETQSKQYQKMLEIINYIFTSIFIIEASLKLLCYQFRYFNSGWNQFDFFVVVVSCLDIIMGLIDSRTGSKQNQKFLKVGPQLARIFRVLRVSRLLKLIKKAKGLKALFQTIVFSIPAVFSIFSLFTLVLFIYAILGVDMFKDIKHGRVIDTNYYNFHNFGNAISMLYKIQTGEDWNYVMQDVSTQSSNQFLSIFYFISFKLFVTDILINLFVLVVIQQFNKYYLHKDNILSKFKENLEVFKETWKTLSAKNGGKRITEKDLVLFFKSMDSSIGMADFSDLQIHREIVYMGIRQEKGWIYFNELLYRSMRRVYGMRDTTNEVLKKQEFKTQFSIYLLSRKMMNQSVLFQNVSFTTISFQKAKLLRSMWRHGRERCNTYKTQTYVARSMEYWLKMAFPGEENRVIQKRKKNQQEEDLEKYYLRHINMYIQDDPEPMEMVNMFGVNKGKIEAEHVIVYETDSSDEGDLDDIEEVKSLNISEGSQVNELRVKSLTQDGDESNIDRQYRSKSMPFILMNDQKESVQSNRLELSSKQGKKLFKILNPLLKKTLEEVQEEKSEIQVSLQSQPQQHLLIDSSQFLQKYHSGIEIHLHQSQNERSINGSRRISIISTSKNAFQSSMGLGNHSDQVNILTIGIERKDNSELALNGPSSPIPASEKFRFYLLSPPQEINNREGSSILQQSSNQSRSISVAEEYLAGEVDQTL